MLKLKRSCVAVLAAVGLIPSLWGARGTTSASTASAILNTSYGPLAGSNGPFTIAFWFQSGNLNQTQAYLVEGGQSNSQWAVIYGFTPGKIEFYVASNSAARVNTAITISDTNWHHIAYRKNASGSAEWDLFLDGVKTVINSSISFTLPSAGSEFITFNADNHANPCVCSLGDVVIFNSALADAAVQSLAAGNHPTVTANTLLYWPLEGTSSPEPDASGNNHPGTVQGNVIQVPDPPYTTSSSVSVTVAPPTASLSVNQSQTFTATVTGSTNSSVNWSVSPATGAGTITSGGVYTAPAAISSTQTVTVTATSVAQTTATGSATVTLTPVSVSISPPTASLSVNQSQTFTAGVTGSSNTAVTWSVSPATGAGTVTSAGVYTAPATISSTQTVNVIATSAADTTKSASATVTLTPVSVSVSPPTASLSVNQSQTFTATVTGSSNTAVTWSVSPATGAGTVTSGGVYTAPATISSTQTVSVIATSAADTTKSASATVTLTPVSVSVSPTTASLSANQSQMFTATVTGSSNTAVTWSVSPTTGAGTITSGGVYTAPGTISSTQTVTVTATSSADPTKSGSATITLTPTTTVSTARGTTSRSTSNVIRNTSYGPLAGSNGPFTVAFWFQSGSLSQTQTYLIEAGQGSSQWAIIYGFTANTIEFYSAAGSSPRQGSGITISDTNWHHIAYRKMTSGSSLWDLFLDGVKQNISPSISFTLPTSSGGEFNAFNSDNSQNPCVCSLGDLVVYNSALTDAQVQGLAAGSHPPLTPDPLLYWPLLGTSNPEPDDSGNNHPGTVDGNVVQVPGPPYAGSGESVVVTVAPSTVSLGVGQTQQFTATVTGSSNTAVTWSLSPATGAGTVSSAGSYTAPSSISTTQTVTVTATSEAQTTQTGSATITLTPVSVSISPTSGTLTAGQTQQFNASVTGSSNTAVTWSLSPASGAGTISGSGLYTAPSSISSTQTVTVTATSAADTTKTATATVTLSPTTTSPPPSSPTSGAGSVARGATTSSASNVIENTSYGPLSGSNGPFTIAFWFQSGNMSQTSAYVMEGGQASSQWAVTYGYSAGQLQFSVAGNSAAGQNTGITIPDTNWHHIAFRKDATGASSWDEFLDGNKTIINSSISFSLPSIATFYLLNSDNSENPCQCNIADVVIYSSARPDAEIQALAAGNHPSLKTNPLLYWPLSGTSTQEPDLSGNGHTGSVLGSVQSVPGPLYLPTVARTIPSNAAGNSSIENTSYGPLSSSNGPFTVAFWFQSLNTSPGQTYVLEGYTSGPEQWAVIYGYTAQEIEFYDGSSTVRAGTGITITDTNWHHIAYRKSASGSSSWDRFLDGVKTNINPSINFTLPPAASFYAFNNSSGNALCYCSLADIALYNTALADTDIQSLAQGARPPSLSESPVLYWPLVGSSPEPDESGNNNPGTLVGGVSTTSAPPYSGTVAVAPATATVLPSASQQFNATVVGGGSTVTWFLNPAFGTISSTGNYTAPASVPTPTNVTVTATSDAFPTQYSTATVVVDSGPPSATPGAVLTWGYDNNRTNSNPNESILNTSNVNVSQFGKLFSLTVDGFVYAQPLYVPQSLVPALGQNTVFIATLNNTLFAFNADTGAELWSFSLGTAASNGDTDITTTELGVLGTPVIDPVREVIYVVARTSSGYSLHAINILNHTEVSGSPVLIGGSVPGQGYDNVGGVVTFSPAKQLQRVGLLLANNTIYVAFGSEMDTDPYHGWFFGYNATTFAQSLICTTPGAGESGIWMSGGAPAVDQSGNIYLVTGNGSWDGKTDFGESVLKLGATLSLLDWFTPADVATLNGNDADFGSSRAILLPSTSLLATGGKDGSLWLLNSETGELGQLQGGPGSPPVVQTFQATTTSIDTSPTHGIFDGIAYWSTAPGGPLLFIQPSNDVAKAYQLTNGLLNETPTAEGSTSYPYPGGALAVSSNGSSGGILWSTTPTAATNSGTANGVLHAYNAQTLAEIWNSTQNSTRDALGLFAKFAPPTVVNGKVYVPTFSNQVVVYGLLP